MDAERAATLERLHTANRILSQIPKPLLVTQPAPPATPSKRTGSEPRGHEMGLLLGDETIADLRRSLPSLRWPRKRLTELLIELAVASRKAHVSPTTENCSARSEAVAAHDSECDYIGQIWVTTLAHAIATCPRTVAEMLTPLLDEWIQKELEKSLRPVWRHITERLEVLEKIVAKLEAAR